jgi:anti-sigma factor RsiW
LALTTVHGYFDGELDAVRAREFEYHLETCAECQASLEHMESLRTQLRQPDLYERASSHLREQIRQQLGPVAPAAHMPSVSSRRRFLIPAFAALAVAGFTAAWFLMQSQAGTSRITSELIDAHVRSLEPGHLTDVESSDQHTVKPWFDGRLDFIPPVSDYSEQGFPLVGGRLDVLNGRRVAALVFSRRKHIISWFVWPARGEEQISDRAGSREGYNWITWRSSDMQFCLVSDVSARDLRELRGLISR